MEAVEKGFVEDERRRSEDLRQQIASVLLDRSGFVTADMVAILPFSGDEALSPEYCRRIWSLLVQLLAFAVSDGRADPPGGVMAALDHIVLERVLPVERLFTYTYLTERAGMYELAVDESIGATSQAVRLVAQLMKQASLDGLAGYSDRIQLEPSNIATTDRL